MVITQQTHPVVVIGGGFYGCSIAEFLANHGVHVVLLEQEPELLTRASYNNQARLHGGYHYPRSFNTAYRSRLNFAQFLQDYRPAIATNFLKLYAIARINSKVSPQQFEFFCRNIEAPLKPAPDHLARLFSSRLIAAVYETEEYAFDAAVLRRLLTERLERAGVNVKLGYKVTAIRSNTTPDQPLELIGATGDGMLADHVFNCTYSGLNTIQGLFSTNHQLKHEITELALVELPDPLKNVSVTVMDGPFFSFMPFPDRGLSTFTHVRYTPHGAWTESSHGEFNPYHVLDTVDQQSNFGFMIRDAQRYLPCLADTCYHDSLFEVKTVLTKNESDDGRPILFEVNSQQPRIVSVLGSKIDNIYDVLVAVSEYLGWFK
jgi:glycine/D-amino acid oxidase-like deaminating enzyme